MQRLRRLSPQSSEMVERLWRYKRMSAPQQERNGSLRSPRPNLAQSIIWSTTRVRFSINRWQM
jgi:hypothetical protein